VPWTRVEQAMCDADEMALDLGSQAVYAS
jgi:hypothetical protein